MGDGLDSEFFDQLIPQPALREGLPPGYRMRHDAHYVEELTQPALPQVRMIAVTDIDGARPPSGRDLSVLVASVARYGVLQPLLVRRHNGRYDLIAGDRRLAAARSAGLAEVPCLVMEADEARAAALNEACRTHVSHEEVSTARQSPRVAIPAAAVGEIGKLLEGIRTCLNLLGDRDRSLFENVAITLVGAEIQRAQWLVDGLAVLAEDPVLARTAINVPALVRGIVQTLQAERGLTSAQLAVQADQRGAPSVQADKRLLGVALGGALIAVLSVAERAEGAVVRCAVTTERERGAVVVELAQQAVTLPASRLARFFDLTWSDRPGGFVAGVGAVAARRIAQLHAGTAEVIGGDEGGCGLRLELPFEQA